MKQISDLHPIQISILVQLLFNPVSKFSDLNNDKLSTDQFSFHLRKLSEEKLILKNKNGKYELTNTGKIIAGKIDTNNKNFEVQGKITMCVVPTKMINGKKQFLFHQRKKQPYFDCWGFVTGKIRWGESVFDAAKRELFEETNLQADELKIIGVFHKREIDNQNTIIQDKHFYIVEVVKFSGELSVDSQEGHHEWHTFEEIINLETAFEDLADLQKMFNHKQMTFFEKTYEAKGF